MAVAVIIYPVLLVVVAIALHLHLHLQRQRQRQLPPGPPSWPIIGSLHHLILGGNPHRALAKLSQQYGPFLFMMLGSRPTVVVSSAEKAALFLRTHDKTFASRPPYESVNHLSYGNDSMVATSPYGEGWRNMRRLYTVQLFTAKRVKECMPIMINEIERLMTEIRGYAEAGEAFNLTAGFGSLLENIVCRIMLGKRLAEVCEVEGGYNLQEAMHEAAELFGKPLIGDMIPWLSFVDAKTIRRMDAWHASVNGVLKRVFEAREEEGAQSSKNNHFLEVLLANNLPIDNVKGVILEILAGGIDTSSVLLDWAMAELLINPLVMKKMEQEVEHIMGYASKKMVEEGDLTQLVYSKAIIKETFRLHPPLPLLNTHMSIEECQVGGYNLPQGTRLFVNAWAIGRDPHFWESSNVFLPDRFLDSYKHVDVRGQNFELIPFGSGRRSCPGIPLALPIIEMSLANIVYYFRWSLLPSPHNEVDMTEKMGLVASRASPLLAIPTLRSL